MEIRLSGHSAYHTEYHIVWIPKYRYHVLNPGVKAYLVKLFPKVMAELPGCEIVKYSIQTDHIHMVMIILHFVKDIPWPNPDWGAISKRVELVKESLIINLAKTSVILAEVPFKKTWPDYFGQSFLVLADECDNAMITGNEALFVKIFPAYFNAALKANDRLRAEIGTSANQETALVYITEPIEDLMQISGYALIYSELDSKKYWGTVKNVWDLYFNNHEKPKETLEAIIAFMRFRESIFAILPHAILRTNWQIKLERRLRKDKILVDESYIPRLPRNED